MGHSFSLAFNGSLWYLLLLIPGFFLLLRVFGLGPGKGYGWVGHGKGSQTAAIIQCLALVLLVFTLTGPELRRHREKFHDPAVVLAVDQSGSFRGGTFLKAKAGRERLAGDLERFYGSRGFRVTNLAFHEETGLEKGFANLPDGTMGEGEGLTDFSALARFLDSSGIPNLQAIFLLSDGRRTLNRHQENLSALGFPVFPVILRSDSVFECQLNDVILDLNDGASHFLDISWSQIGRTDKRPVFELISGGQSILRRVLADSGSTGTGVERRNRIQWDGEIADGPGRLRAVLRPQRAEDNINFFNDTLDVQIGEGKGNHSIYIVKPVVSPDEKWMLAILGSLEGYQVRVRTVAELEKLRLGREDQVWASDHVLSQDKALAAFLGRVPSHRVIYSLGSAPVRHFFAVSPETFRSYSTDNKLQVKEDALPFFYDQKTELSGISHRALFLPIQDAEWITFLSVAGSSGEGVLAGKFYDDGGRELLKFALPGVWKAMFDPRREYDAKKRIHEYIRAMVHLAEREERGVQVNLPPVAYHNLKFDLTLFLPRHADSIISGEKGENGLLIFESSRKKRELKAQESAAGKFTFKQIMLPEGEYSVSFINDGNPLWSDSLRVVSRQSLEMAKIGFDRRSLQSLASATAGEIIVEPNGIAGSTEHSEYAFPNLPKAQVKEISMKTTPLYNNRTMFIVIVGLLAFSWFLRKKLNMD